MIRFLLHVVVFLGGIGLISTFVALFVANLVPYGLSIRGLKAWVFATPSTAKPTR